MASNGPSGLPLIPPGACSAFRLKAEEPAQSTCHSEAPGGLGGLAPSGPGTWLSSEKPEWSFLFLEPGPFITGQAKPARLAAGLVLVGDGVCTVQGGGSGVMGGRCVVLGGGNG